MDRNTCFVTMAVAAERKPCEAAAREQWKQETRDARRHLLNDSSTLR